MDAAKNGYVAWLIKAIFRVFKGILLYWVGEWLNNIVDLYF